MNYFDITHSFNLKIIGKYPQSSLVNEVSTLKGTSSKTKGVTILLDNKAKVTDLISVVYLDFSLKRVVSNGLKIILEREKNNLIFSNASLQIGDKQIDDYWIIDNVLSNMEYIDYKKSQIISRRRKPGGGTYITKEEIFSKEDFYTKLINYSDNKTGKIYLDKIVLYENLEDEFFTLTDVEGGVKYVVSEKLKKEIEDAGCTGIEFQPIELSLNEWLAPGGEREKIYGKSR